VSVGGRKADLLFPPVRGAVVNLLHRRVQLSRGVRVGAADDAEGFVAHGLLQRIVAKRAPDRLEQRRARRRGVPCAAETVRRAAVEGRLGVGLVELVRGTAPRPSENETESVIG